MIRLSQRREPAARRLADPAAIDRHPGQLDYLIDVAARRKMILEALAFLVELETARKDGRRTGWQSRPPTFGRRVRRSRSRRRHPRRLTHQAKSLPFPATATACARNAALSSSQATPSAGLPEAAASTRSKGQSLAPPPRARFRMSLGHQRQPRLTGARPLKIATVNMGETEHQDALFPGFGRERIVALRAP